MSDTMSDNRDEDQAMTHEQAADVFREFMAIVDKAPNTFIHELYRDIYEAAAVAIPLLEAATIPPETSQIAATTPRVETVETSDPDELGAHVADDVRSEEAVQWIDCPNGRCGALAVYSVVDGTYYCGRCDEKFKSRKEARGE